MRPGTTTATVDATTLPPGLTQTEGTGTATVNAIAGQNTFVGNNGYTRNEGTVPKTGSDSTLGGTGLGLGLVTLGGGAGDRRPHPATPARTSA